MISKIKIICIGKIKEDYINNGILEYLKRLKIFVDIEIIELKDRGIEIDTDNIIKKIQDENTKNIFIMDERGSDYSSIEFSEVFSRLEEKIIFVIGGAEGLLKSIKDQNKCIRLSKMTFTHEMARLFLVEQIYRSFMIINNRSYHK